MKGESDTEFGPYLAITRGMIVTILYRLEGEPVVPVSCSFEDVADGAYYEDTVAWAEANDVVEGYGDGSFGPNDIITREQMATILYRYAAYRDYEVSGTSDLSKFVDAEKISGYAMDAMSWSNAHGLINGRGYGVLDPQGSTLRCEVAAMLHRFCNAVVE